MHLNDDRSLSPVTKSHAGHYQCRADNGLEPAIDSDFQLLVLGMMFLYPQVVQTCFTRHWVLSVQFSQNEALSRAQGKHYLFSSSPVDCFHLPHENDEFNGGDSLRFPLPFYHFDV